MDKIIGDPKRLAVVAKDFVEHYEKRIEEGSTVCGKAMFVCSNRQIAYDLYKQIIALRPEWEAERVKMVMTRSKDDNETLYNLLGNDEDKKRLDLSFKDPESEFKIAIVVDMWITGFDVPCLDTMYIDKPLQRHTLIQTISRVNRVYEGKDKGLVVDYIGIKSNMNNALKQYAGGGDMDDNVETIEKSLTMVKDELDILRRMFAKFDYSKFINGSPLEQLDCLKHAAEFVQSTEKMQNLFMGHVRKLKSAFNLCSNHDDISDKEREDIHFFTGVRSIVYKLTKGDAPDVTQMNQRVSKMLQEALQSEGVEEVAQVNADSKDLDLLSEEYMARLEKLQMPNTKVKLMEKLLRTVITEFKKVNKMKGVDFTKRLNELVNRYNDRSDNAVFAQEVLDEVAKQMAELLKEVNKEKKSFKELGITYEEKAFYDILKEIAHKFGFEYPENKLLTLSAAVKKMVDDKSKYTDWANRSDIKAELQMDLILILAEHGYPPVPQDEVFKEIFEQAENFKKYEQADEDDAMKDANVISMYPSFEEGEKMVAAEDIFIYGSIPVDLPNTKREELANGKLDLVLMYAIGSGARQKTEAAGKIALGIKEGMLKEEQMAAYKGVKYLIFHYWSNPMAYLLTKEPVLVDKNAVPSEYLIRMDKDAVKYLLLDYMPQQSADLGNINILKTQRKGEIRYLPFVTTLESIVDE